MSWLNQRVDDQAAASPWERDLLVSAAPDTEVRLLTVAEAAAAWEAERIAPGGAMLVLRDLRAARTLVESGAAVPVFTLGGLHYAPGKAKIAEYVYLDDADREDARALLHRGVRLEVQDVPATRPQGLMALDPTVAP